MQVAVDAGLRDAQRGGGAGHGTLEHEHPVADEVANDVHAVALTKRCYIQPARAQQLGNAAVDELLCRLRKAFDLDRRGLCLSRRRVEARHELLSHGVDGAHGREVGVDAEHTDNLVILADKVRRRLQRLATGTTPLVACNKWQVAILGVVHDLECQIGGGTADLTAAYDAVANIDDGVVGIREIVQHDFAVFAEYLLQEIDHRQKTTYGLVHGQLLWVLSKCS